MISTVDLCSIKIVNFTQTMSTTTNSAASIITADNVCQIVRDSCEHAVSIAKDVKINDSKIDQFIEEYVIKNIQSKSNFFTLGPTPTPLKFDSIDHEINFHFLNGMLQFGSGFRLLLHKYCDQGASDTIVFGLLSLVISGSKLDTD